MDHTSIPYQDTGYLSPIIADYLSRSENLHHFYKYPFSADAIAQVIADKTADGTDRTLLVEVLKDQYRPIPAKDKVAANIESLGQANTFTITTAHQPCLFTGRLYFIYKIISVINTTEHLKSLYPDKHFVPVYWIGGEDHDFEEINHIYVHGEKLSWESGEKGPVGRMSTRHIEKAIVEVKEKLGGRPFSNELFQLLRDTYLKHPTLSEATAALVNELFGEYGLVVIRQDDARFKKKFAHVIADEILHHRVHEATNGVIEKINQHHYKLQANPREINIFYLDDQLRERIVFSEKSGRFEVLNTGISFSKEELQKEIEEHPEHFSPNVFLRPLLQEILLPNLAYIGGAGETAYWLELKGIFDHYKVNFPMLMLRNSALLIDHTTQKKIDKLELSDAQLFLQEDDLIKQFVRSHSENALDLNEEKKRIEEIFAQVKAKAVSIDVTLEKAVDGQKTIQLNGLENIEKKILRAEKHNFETAVNQIKNIKARLFPNHNLQERVDNILPYYAQYGQDFIGRLKNVLPPFSTEFSILREREN